jgi:hypothetical protein
MLLNAVHDSSMCIPDKVNNINCEANTRNHSQALLFTVQSKAFRSIVATLSSTIEKRAAQLACQHKPGT